MISTGDPYSMIYLSLASRPLLRVAHGMKKTASKTTTASHPCIDGSLRHHRKYHRLTADTPSLPRPDAAQRIRQFLLTLGPGATLHRRSHVCDNCRAWRTTDFATCVERFAPSGSRSATKSSATTITTTSNPTPTAIPGTTSSVEIVLDGFKQPTTAETYTNLWAHRPEKVDNFCPACVMAKVKMDGIAEKEAEKAGKKADASPLPPTPLPAPPAGSSRSIPSTACSSPPGSPRRVVVEGSENTDLGPGRDRAGRSRNNTWGSTSSASSVAATAAVSSAPRPVIEGRRYRKMRRRRQDLSEYLAREDWMDVFMAARGRDPSPDSES